MQPARFAYAFGHHGCGWGIARIQWKTASSRYGPVHGRIGKASKKAAGWPIKRCRKPPPSMTFGHSAGAGGGMGPRYTHILAFTHLVQVGPASDDDDLRIAGVAEVGRQLPLPRSVPADVEEDLYDDENYDDSTWKQLQ